VRTIRWVSCTTAAMVLASACLDRRELLPPDERAPRSVAMALNLELRGGVAAGERVVDIRARYQRRDGERPTLPVQPARVTLQDGTTIQQSVVVDIGPCNADADREPNEDGSPGCRFAMELTLRNAAGDVLGNDEKMVGPVGPGAPAAPTFLFTAPALTVDPASLAFTGRNGQAPPAAQNVGVAVDIPGAAIGTLSAAIALDRGENWLRATVDQGARAIAVQPTTTALAAGAYSAVVSVTSSVDGLKPRTFDVSYQIGQQPILTVSGAGGDGSGTVTSSPGGISCAVTNGSASGTCSATFEPGTVVTLSATPTGNNRFDTWGGSCSGSASCSVTVTQPTTVTARFLAPLPVLTVAGAGGNGSGIVTSAPPGISCGIAQGTATGTCSAAFNPNTAVVLTARPAGQDLFTSWGGACTGSGSCSVTVTQPTTVTARFDVPPPVLSLAPTTLSFAGVSRSPTSPPRQSIAISNRGGGSLGAITIANIAYSASATGWLDATITGAAISVGATPANVPAGNHSATVTVRSANGGTATFIANFAVTNPPPRIALTPNALAYSVTVGFSPPGKTARASNVGTGTFADLGLLSVGTGTSNWLRVSFDGDIVVVSPIVSSFKVGTYTGTAVVSSVRGGSASIAVSLTVNPVIVERSSRLSRQRGLQP
jgi:hypothetical protein